MTRCGDAATTTGRKTSAADSARLLHGGGGHAGSMHPKQERHRGGLVFGNTSPRPRYPLATRRSASVDGTRNLRQTTLNRRKSGAAQTHHQRQGGGIRYRGRQEARQLQQERVVRHPHQHLPTSTAVGQPIESVKRDSRGGANFGVQVCRHGWCSCSL